MGKYAMAVGFAAGYLLGAKAGKERYQQITDQTRQLMERPQVKRVTEQVSSKVSAAKERATTAARSKPDAPLAMPSEPTVVPPVDAAAMPPDPTVLPGETPPSRRRRHRRSRDPLS